MKNTMIAALAIGGLVLALHSSAVSPDKEKTIIGDGACAKCLLKETKECRQTITTEGSGKKVTYYLVQNDVSKQFGDQLCTGKKKVKATGIVTTVDGRQELTPSKMELSKE